MKKIIQHDTIAEVWKKHDKDVDVLGANRRQEEIKKASTAMVVRKKNESTWIGCPTKDVHLNSILVWHTSPSGSRMRPFNTMKHVPALDETKAKLQGEVVPQAKKEGRNVHIASLMDICHFKKSAERSKQFQR